MKVLAITASILALSASGVFAEGVNCPSKADRSARVVQPIQSTTASTDAVTPATDDAVRVAQTQEGAVPAGTLAVTE